MEMKKAQFEELKRRYRRALRKNEEFFVFNGEKVRTDYAKYMIEFLKPKFNYK